MKKCLSITLSVVLLLTAVFIYTPSIAAKDSASDAIDTSDKVELFSSSAEDKKLVPAGDEVFTSDDTDDEKPSFVENEAIVTVSVPDGKSSPLTKEGAFSEDDRILIRKVMSFGSFFTVHVTSDELSADELIDVLSEYPYVTDVTPNYCLSPTEVDPLASEQWYLNDETFRPGSSHQNVSADADISYKKESYSPESVAGNTPIVAVVDTGIDYTHEDLKDKMWINPYPSLPGVYGYDFCNNREDPFPTSSSDTHGTAVASVIAASTDNGVGISGISRDAKLMSLKIFDSDNDNNSGTIAVQLAAFEYIYKAKRLGANIVAVNCSFCVMPSSNPYTDLGNSVISSIDAAIEKLGEMGVLFVYAAGNEGESLEEKPYGLPYQQDLSYLLVAGATDYKGNVSPFSNYSPKHVHLMAPGSTILTATTKDNFLPATYDDAKKNRLCTFCEDFPSGKRTILRDANNTAITVSHSTEDIHGDVQSGSGMVTIKDASSKNTDDYMVYYDVTDYDIKYDNSAKYYFSFTYMVSTKGTATWFDLSGRMGTHKAVQAWKTLKTGRYYLSINIQKLFTSTALTEGMKVYFDSFSLSAANPNTSEFGKYMYVNGTSFSAPCVSGAVARLASVFPNESASYRKQFILDNVYKNAEYADKCSSGGLLNMSAFPTEPTQPDNPTIYATGLKLNKTKATLKSGKKLKLKATVLPSDATDKRITWKTSKKSYASVSKKGVVKAKKKGRGHTVKITAVLTGNKEIKKICKVKIKK